MKNGIIGIVGLVLVTALFAGCGSLSDKSKPTEEKSIAAIVTKPTEEESVAVFKKLGGKFYGNRERLDLTDTNVTDAQLVYLKGLTGLKGLKGLGLDRTDVTEAGLVHLEGLTRLEGLFLQATKITDAGLVHLKGLTGLQVLILTGTEVTDASVDKLQAALPKCKIDRRLRGMG